MDETVQLFLHDRRMSSAPRHQFGLKGRRQEIGFVGESLDRRKR